MDTVKQLAIDHLLENKRRLTDQIKFVKSLPDGLTGSVSAWEHSVNITIPYDLDGIRKERAALGSGFKMFGKPRVDSDGDWVATFYRKDDVERKHMVILYASTTRDGATCKRVKIGTKEVPIYKIVCEG